MNNGGPQQLIRELLSDPGRFTEQGRAYDLLQLYFGGHSLDTLRPLLRHSDVLIQRAAVFVASELGGKARELIRDVIPLLGSADRHSRYYAMDVLAVCAEGDVAQDFAHLAQMLETTDDVLRRRAMRLIAAAAPSQLEAALRFFRAPERAQRSHERGLSALLQGERLQPDAVVALLRDSDALVRRYGVIAAKARSRDYPDPLLEAKASDDDDVRSFALDVVQNPRA